MTKSNLRKVGVFPGQFDPITNGHLDVIKRGCVLFDELIVAVGVNPDKRELFDLDERVEMIGELLKGIPGARVQKYTGLTADFVKGIKATAILRGIRDVSDLRYEFQLALANRAVGGVETVFIMTSDQYALTSSSLIRQIVELGGNMSSLKASSQLRWCSACAKNSGTCVERSRWFRMRWGETRRNFAIGLGLAPKVEESLRPIDYPSSRTRRNDRILGWVLAALVIGGAVVVRLAAH